MGKPAVPPIKAGDVIWCDIPVSSGGVQLRPAVVLYLTPKYNDLIVSTISTRLYQEIKGLDYLIDTGSADFQTSGLRQPSLIRLMNLNTVSLSTVRYKTGSISPQTLTLLRNRLDAYLKTLR